jgi:hypothetical protein
MQTCILSRGMLHAHDATSKFQVCYDIASTSVNEYFGSFETNNRFENQIGRSFQTISTKFPFILLSHKTCLQRKVKSPSSRKLTARQKKKRPQRKLLFSNLSKSDSYFRASKPKTVLEAVSSLFPSAKKTKDIASTETRFAIATRHSVEVGLLEKKVHPTVHPSP